MLESELLVPGLKEEILSAKSEIEIQEKKIQSKKDEIIAREADIAAAYQELSEAVIREASDENEKMVPIIDRKLKWQIRTVELLRKEKEQLRAEKEKLREHLGFLYKKEDQHSIPKSEAMSVDSSGEPLMRTEIVHLKFEQTSASSFTASQGKSCDLCLFNGNKPVSFNCPEIIRKFFKFGATEDLIAPARAAVLAGLPQTMFPVKVSETRPGGSEKGIEPTIQQEAGNSLLNFLATNQDPQIIKTSQTKLEDVQSGYGPASHLATPDGLWYVQVSGRKLPLGCLELKDSAFSPLEQTGQAFASGANLALSQERWGLASSHVAVPLLMTNGQLYQFAMATLLDQIPVLHILTNILDANDPSNLEKIAKQLVMVRTHMVSQAAKLIACARVAKSAESSDPSDFPFDTRKYFLKSKDSVYNRFESSEKERKALPLLWEIFEALSGVEGVVMPFGYGRLKGLLDFSGCDMGGGGLVFPNLLPGRFTLGVPVDSKTYEAFCSRLEHVIHEVHARGIIHVDLYPSNILWSAQNDEVDVRIIDWDAATFAGKQFTEHQYERLRKVPDRYYTPDLIARPENDAWHVFILSRLSETQRPWLQGADATHAGRVISGYLTCIREMIMESGGLENLQQTFLAWFRDFELRGRELGCSKRQRPGAQQPSEPCGDGATAPS
jgi:hypothetical protein